MHTKIDKRFCVIMLLLALGWRVSIAQVAESKHSIGLYQSFSTTNATIFSGDILSPDSSLSQAVRVAYQRRLSHNWVLNAGVTNGFILHQNLRDIFVKKAYAVGIDAAVFLKMNNGKLLKENARLSPFLSFGYRADYVHQLKQNSGVNPWFAARQYGAGFNVRLAVHSHLQLHALIDEGLSGDFNTAVVYRIGLTHGLKKNRWEKQQNKKYLDSDNDGVLDIEDLCSQLFGLKVNEGCPDSAVFFIPRMKMDSLMLVVAKQQDAISKLEWENAVLRDSSIPAMGHNNELVATSKKRLTENEQRIVLSDKRSKETHKPREATVDVVLEKTKTNQTSREVNGQIDTTAQVVNSSAQLVPKRRSKSEEVRTERAKLTTVKKQQLPKGNEEILTQKVDETRQKQVVSKNQIISENTDVVKQADLASDKNYYVITISSPNHDTAMSMLTKMKMDFQDVHILPQPNGYYRVGVYAGKNKQDGTNLLKTVRTKGYETAWLSVE